MTLPQVTEEHSIIPKLTVTLSIALPEVTAALHSPRRVVTDVGTAGVVVQTLTRPCNSG